jgi:RND family efflux transporter MFP subunit
VEPLPFAIAVGALVEGVVAEVRVLEGESVRRGQTVAHLVDEDARIALAAAEAAVAAALAQLELRQAELARAEETLETLIAPDRRLRVAEARYAAANAERERADSEALVARSGLASLDDELRRKRPLVEIGVVAEGEIVRLELAREGLAASLAALGARRAAAEAAALEAGAELEAARIDRDRLIDERAAVAIARAAERAAIAALRAAEAERDAARLALERTEIKSPIDGVVLARLVAPGSPVSPREGPPIVTLYEPARLQVRADVANADITLVGRGMPATVTAEALPGTAISGTVRLVTAQADIQKNTVQIKVELHDPPAALVPEMLCRVRIGGAAGAGGGVSSRQRLLAPARLLRGDRALVALPDRDGIATVEARSIERGAADAGWVEVRSGLRPGELLVDPERTSAGARVRVRNIIHDPSDGRSATDELR